MAFVGVRHMTSAAAHPDDLAVGVLLRAHGVRYNRTRQEVVARLRVAGRPLSAEELRQGDASLAYSSLYRTLQVLESAGVVGRLVGADGVSRFELAEEISGEHHHHLVCSRCGMMSTIVLPAVVEQGLARAAHAAQGATGFRVDGHRVELIGRCRQCPAREA
jgi:Fur family ferric uptake transcriptional regulator